MMPHGCDTRHPADAGAPILDLEISPQLRRTVADVGDEGSRWLATVPALVARIAEEWQLQVGAQITHSGVASIILAVTTREGTPAVLKLSVPHEEARQEAAALARWDGDGAVRLLRRDDDGFVLLLERCDPDRDLWSLEVDEQVEVMAGLFPRLWVPWDGPAAPTVADTCRRWEREMAAKAADLGVPGDVAARARRWALELSSDESRCLLHGDLHPGNVLPAPDGRWVVIDPKPWVGDPAFDLAQLLANWIRRGHTPSAGEVHARAEQLAARLDLDVDRVLRWATVKSIGWDIGRDEAVLLDAAARSGS